MSNNQKVQTVDYRHLKEGKNPVYFMSQGYKLAGDLYLPKDFDSNKKYPTVIYTRPGTQVKEQTGTTYGVKLSAKGYVFLAFDPKNFGDSEGEVRNYESIHNMVPNTTDAISFLRTLKFIDRDKFYGLGACAGAPYICNVAIGDVRIKAVATLVGNFDAAASLFGAYPKELLDKMLAVAAEAKQRYYETGEYDTAPTFGGMPIPLPDSAPKAMKDGYEYYFNRAGQDKCPNYSPYYPTIGLPVDPSRVFVNQAKYFTTPFLVIAGSEAFTRDMDKQVFDMAAGEKEWMVIEGASHMDLYDIDQYLDPAMDKVDEFFKKYW
ncbi:alpha/beta hydrolase [uncultured Bacteroides sp.]|uniref:alpha/beta hydrolase n=1 Tax=uncultured Bacteroides sp. TaxID=162156 RepID=UPI002AA649EF|nr:alpha/beta hydrolase [uncultured Bacteroides sp.]